MFKCVWHVLDATFDQPARQCRPVSNYTTNDQLQNNAGEYIIATKDGGYAVYVDSQTYGPQGNGGNFAVMKLAPDEVERSNHAHAP